MTLGAARAEAALGRCDRASKLALGVIKSDPKSVDAYAVRGYALCLDADFDQGVKHLRESLRLDPDHGEAQRLCRRMKRAGGALERGREAAARRDFESASKNFTDALEAAEAPVSAPVTATLFGLRANANVRLRRYDDALRDCAASIESREDHKPAYYTMSTALLAEGRAEEAAAALERLLAMDPSDETTRRHRDKARFEVRKQKRPDYYAISGARVASVPEIKAGTSARAWSTTRPPRGETRGGARRGGGEVQALGRGAGDHGGPDEAQLYNEGYDKEAIAERAEAARRAAHRGGHHGCGGGGGGCC